MIQVYGARDAATIRPRRHITIAYPAPRETLLGVPDPLPTSEPITPQVSFTIDASDMPTVTGLIAGAYTYIGFMYAAGHNTSGDVRTLGARYDRNGITQFSGDNVGTVSDGNCWTYSNHLGGNPWGDIEVGDVLEMWFWADAAGMDVDYQALALYPTQLRSEVDGQLLISARYTPALLPALTLGTPSQWLIFGAIVSSGLALSTQLGGFPSDVEAIVFNTGIYGAFLNSELADDSVRPSYNAFNAPTDVSYYPTSIRVTL